jgi:hypothetical protein
MTQQEEGWCKECKKFHPVDELSIHTDKQTDKLIDDIMKLIMTNHKHEIDQCGYVLSYTLESVKQTALVTGYDIQHFNAVAAIARNEAIKQFKELTKEEQDRLK